MCDICNRAKLFPTRIRSHRILDPESDLPESSKFGEQVAVDHMVVWKSSGGKEFLVLIGYDSFSGIANAHPASSKGFMSSSFCWPEIQKPRHGCRSDAAPELVKAIGDLEWLPETALPRRWPHNSKCECTIRTLEECCRCLLLKLVLQSCPSRGQSLAGMRQLQLALKVGGEILEQNSKVQITHLVNWCFIELNLNTNQSGIQMHHQLSWLDGSWNLDLALSDGAEKTLEHFAGPSTDGLEQQDPLPIPFIEDTPEVRKKTKRVYITFGRIQRLGPTPGCRACLAFTPNHTPECVARHEEAHGHASPAPTPRGQGELEELLDEAFPPGLDFDYEPSIASHDPLDDDLVPACPPPDVFPEDDPVYGVTSGMAVTVLRAPKHGKGKHNRVGKDVLFQFACAKDSNLGKVGQGSGVRAIRPCKEDTNLEDPHSIEQIIAQVGALEGCSIHCSIECKPWSQWQHLNRAKYPKLTPRIRQEQAESAALVEQFIRVADICLDNGGDCSFEWPRFLHWMGITIDSVVDS